MAAEAKLSHALSSRGVGDGVVHAHHSDDTAAGAGAGAGAGHGSSLRRESEARLAAALAASGQPPEFGQSPDVFTGIYWFRELLTRSKEGRRMDLITVRSVGAPVHVPSDAPFRALWCACGALRVRLNRASMPLY